MTPEPDRQRCAYCGKPLDAGHIEGIPAYDQQIAWGDEEANVRYCSTDCLLKRILELFHRQKMPGEKWSRFAVEVPPEMASLLDQTQRSALGVDAASASRAGMVRAGLSMYLTSHAKLPGPSVEATAEDGGGELSEGGNQEAGSGS